LAILTALSVDEAQSFLADYGGGALLSLAAIPAGTVNSSYAVELLARPEEAQQGPPILLRRFLRIYEEQDHVGATAEAELLTSLAAKGVVTPPPLRRRDGTVVGRVAGKPAALFPWCEGQHRCLRRVSVQDAHRVGEALARLHTAGRHVVTKGGRFEPVSLRARLPRIACAKDPMLAAQAVVLAHGLDAWCARRDSSLDRGLIHGDLFRDNVLWDSQGAISALLDFESASLGVLAYDLMVTVLAWCVRDELVPDLARSVVVGYRTVRDLSEAERRGLLAEGCIAALRFTITRITDDALRALETGGPPRPDKDWRRFAMRRERLEAMGESGLRALLDL
jgi:homoserine kinase type II